MNPAMGNGGFPLPAPGGAERLVDSHHSVCATTTRLRLPAVLPAGIVKRVVCDACAQPYEADWIAEVMPAGPGIVPDFDRRWLTLPVAGLAVFAALSLVRGDDAAPTVSVAPPTAKTAAAHDAHHEAGGAAARKHGSGSAHASVPSDAQLVSESSFSIALPAGWDRVMPSSGATFAAVSPDGDADATLWIQSDPKLDMATFEANSLAQLKSLAGSAGVVDRQAGPTAESSSVKLAPANAPEGAPAYEVVLRNSGDNWYYLATTYQASADAQAVAGVDLIQGSFLPLGGKSR